MGHIAEDEGPFAEFLGIRVLESDGGRGKAVMPVRREFLHGGGVVQGGLIVTLADHCIYLAVRSVMKEDETTLTVELKVNFIAPVAGGELTAEARIVSRGNRILVGEVDVRDDVGTLIVRALGTSIVRGKW